MTAFLDFRFSSCQQVDDHFGDFNEMVNIGSGATRPLTSMLYAITIRLYGLTSHLEFQDNSMEEPCINLSKRMTKTMAHQML